MITAAGQILLDGVTYETLSGAGTAVLGGAAVNGWEAWRLGDSGPTLWDIREKFLGESEV